MVEMRGQHGGGWIMDGFEMLTAIGWCDLYRWEYGSTKGNIKLQRHPFSPAVDPDNCKPKERRGKNRRGGGRFT